tara:strand:+ start:2672 stop:3466 length:795 start_codon:yes stop_codon:yes gene_type:complete
MSEEAIQETGSQPEAAPVNFIDTLPEDLRAEPSLKNIMDVGNLAKSYVHAQRMIGSDKIPLPGKSASDEDWSLVYDKLGRPTDANGYQITLPETFGEENMEIFKKAAYDAGLNSKQAAAMAEMLGGQLNNASEQYKTNAENLAHESEMELRKEYGQAFKQKMQKAYQAAEYFAGENADILELELADGRMLGDHPEVARMFVSLSELIQEDNVEGKAQDAVMTPIEASRELAELQAEGSPYWLKNHPQHDSYVERVKQLFELQEE